MADPSVPPENNEARNAGKGILPSPKRGDKPSVSDMEEVLNRLSETEARLELSEKRYRRIIDSTPAGFMQLDNDLTVIDTNRALLEMLALDRPSVIGIRADDLYDRNSVNFLSASRDHLSFEAQFNTADRGPVPMLFNRSILTDNEGRKAGFLVFLTDLTELENARKELEKAEHRYRDMVENAVQGMFQISLAGRLIRINPSYARIMGYDSTEALLAETGNTIDTFFDFEDRKEMVSLLMERKILTGHELRMKRPDGSTVWLLLNARLVEYPPPPIIEGIIVDITRLKQMEGRLRRSEETFRHMAVHDNLTGLYNTRYLYSALDELVEKSLQSGIPFSLVFMDMDNFKRVVDTYGHLNGSRALQEVAQTIRSVVEEPCFGVAYGGDEFVIVLPGQDKDGALETAETIRTRMKQTMYLSGQGYRVQLRASFGVAVFPEDAEDRTELLALADRAMFRVKESGKDSVGSS